jgi:ABC-type cobalamin/Fe3+-siderophores transport system ATPase subunit
MAVRCFPHLILLNGGAIVADGLATEVLTVETIECVFRVQVASSLALCVLAGLYEIGGGYLI